jgi:hypothetical protein
VRPDLSKLGRSENPFKLAFWLGSIDPRPFAIFRIGLGLSLLHDLVDYTHDLRAFLADDGMLPRSVPRAWWAWSVFNHVGGLPAISVLFALGCLAMLAFTLGWKTRPATVVSWVFLSSLHHRNYFVTDGGDDLARILLFWAMFCDLGAAYSLDARARPTRIRDMPAFVPRLLQLHVGVLYFCAARLKLGQGWLRGEAIYQTLQMDGFVRPFGGWLGRHPDLCALATRGILAMELAFIFFAFAPVWRKQTRAIAIALGLAIQFGILVAMRVGIFTEVMLWVCAMFIQPEWIDGASAWWRARRQRRTDERPRDSFVPHRLALPLYALLGLQFVVAVWDQFAGRRFPLPALVQREKVALDIVQPMGLFDVVYAVPKWSAPGSLLDGTPIDVLDAVAPGARARQPGLSFSRWNKFLFKDRDFPFRFAELGDYFCRAYNERASGPPLAAFVLTNDRTPPHDPAGRGRPPEHLVLWRQACRLPPADAAVR